jgi:hypothetical protein
MLREFAAELGIADDVFFIGRCDRVGELLFASDIGVLSSKAEGFANAVSNIWPPGCRLWPPMSAVCARQSQKMKPVSWCSQAITKQWQIE